MDTSIAIQAREHPNTQIFKNEFPKIKTKTITCVLIIILGLGGLILGGVGLGRHLGSIMNPNPLNSMIMMACGGIGIAFLIIGIICLGKEPATEEAPPLVIERLDPTVASAIRIEKPTLDTLIKTQGVSIDVDTHNGLIYGPDAWEEAWGIKVSDHVLEAPKIDWDAQDPFFSEAYRENYSLIYIPNLISVDGLEKQLSLTSLIDIVDEATFGDENHPFFERINNEVKRRFGNTTADGWVLMSTKVIPKSRGAAAHIQEDMVMAKPGFYTPPLLEGVALSLMELSFKGKQAYAQGSYLTYARLQEKIDSRRIFIGGLTDDGIRINYDDNTGAGIYGMACALRDFSSCTLSDNLG